MEPSASEEKLHDQGIPKWNDNLFVERAQNQGWWDVTMPNGERLMIPYEKGGLFKAATPSTWAQEYSWWINNGFVHDIALNSANAKFPYDKVVEANNKYVGMMQTYQEPYKLSLHEAFEPMDYREYAEHWHLPVYNG